MSGRNSQGLISGIYNGTIIDSAIDEEIRKFLNNKEIINERLRNFLYIGNDRFYGLKYYVSYGADNMKSQISENLTAFALKTVNDKDF